MNFKKNIAVYSTMTALAFFAVLGWSIAFNRGGEANAQNDDSKVDSATLDSLYEAAFHRPADSEGKGFHLGRDLKAVLKDFNNSQEMRYYGALFKAVKSYEEAQRSPGTLTEDQKKAHLDLIDSALSTLLAWVATLPDHATCREVVGAEEARTAIQSAFDGMSSAAKLVAEKGVFNALKHIGRPNEVSIRNRCLRPSPLVSASPSPTASPNASPTASPTASPSPTATP